MASSLELGVAHSKKKAFSLDVIGLIVSVIALGIAVFAWVFPDFKDVAVLLTAGSFILLAFLGYKYYRAKGRERVVLPASLEQKVDPLTRQEIRDQFSARLPNKSELANQVQKGASKQITIIVGASGVGKSYSSLNTLITVAREKGFAVGEKQFDLNLVDKGCDLFATTEYSSKLNDRLIDWIRPDVGASKIIGEIKSPKIIIFDQFESLLNQPVNDRLVHVTMIAQILEQVVPSVPVLIYLIIREESFSKIFENLRLSLSALDVFRVTGIPVNDKDALNQILLKAGEITKDQESAKTVLAGLQTEDNVITYLDPSGHIQKLQTLRPIEITIVLKALRALGVRSQEFIEKGTTEIVYSYLNQFLLSAKHKLNSARVLYTLSVNPTSNRILSTEQISRLTNLSQEEVEEVLSELTDPKIGLIREIPDERNPSFDWKHDFLAEQFNSLSGSLLDPRDRDNINYFWNRYKKHGYPPSPSRETIGERRLRTLYGWTAFYASMFILFLRMLLPIVGRNDWQAPFNYAAVSGHGFDRIDIFFFFILISLGCWALYTCWIHNRLFAMIEESRFDKLFSTLLPLVSFLCVVGTSLPDGGTLKLVGPKYWVMYTGIGGLFVGIKFLQLAKTGGQYLNIPILARRGGLFLKAGRETIVNSTVVGIFGYYIYPRLFGLDSFLKQSTIWEVGVVSFCLWVIMVWFAVGVSIKEHASSSIVPVLIGDHARNAFRV